MRRSWRAVALASASIFIFSACTGGGGSPSPGGATASPAGSAASAGPPESAGTGFDPQSISGTVILSGWQASGEEGTALQATLDAFEAEFPNITLDYQPIATDYPTAAHPPGPKAE